MKKRQHGCLKRTMATALVLSMILPYPGVEAKTQNVQRTDSTFLEQLEKNYNEPAQQNKTEVRWWLAEGSHTDKTIKEEIAKMHKQGFTGFELCMLDEAGSDDNTYAYGSEEWSHDVKTAIETATSYGMSVGITSGTHWMAANIPGLDPNSEAAGQEVGYSVEKVKAGQSKNGALKLPNVRRGYTNDEVNRSLISVYAYRIESAGSESQADPMVLDQSKVYNITDKVNKETKELNWTAPADGDYVIYSLWQQGTFQQCDPAQQKCYAINYVSDAGVNALENYFSKNIFSDKELVNVIKKGNVQFFMDSLEIGTSQGGRSLYWSKDMANEFMKRKGYDITPYLPLFIGIYTGSTFTGAVTDINAQSVGPYILNDTKDVDGADLTWQITRDYYDVLTQLVQEKLMIPLKKWAHDNYNMKLRAQNAYGTYFEISEMTMPTDYTETETFNMKDQLDMYRLWSGGAHIMNKLYSSETGAIGGMNYALTEQDDLNMSYIQYAAGVNRIIWHGHSSSWGPEKSTSWPGYEGMYAGISTRLDSREPNSKDYAEMNDHMGRVQELLREGVSQTDLGILHLNYGENSAYPFPKYDKLQEHKGIYWHDISLQDAGYIYDYFSPAYLEKMNYDSKTDTLGENVGYQAILIQQQVLDADDAAQLLKFAKQGLKVVILDGAATKTPYNDNREAELAATMTEMKSLDNVVTVATEADAKQALESLDVLPRAELVGSNPQILTQLRKDGKDEYLYAYNYCNDKSCGLNHGLNATTDISMDGTFIPYYIDSWTGKVEKVANYHYEDGRTVFTIDLDYGDVALYAFEPVNKQEKHATKSTAEKVVNKDGNLFVRSTENGKFTTTLNDGKSYVSTIKVPKSTELTNWNLKVENWTQGNQISREETRNTTVYNPETGELVPQNVTTKEVKYETKKDLIETKLTYLDTWDNIPEIGKDVSGIGYYSTTFKWDSKAANGAYLNLGKFPQSAVVRVNGKKADPVNVMNAVVDISKLLKDGKNTIDITVTSTLTNRLLAMGRANEGAVGFNDYEVKYFSNGLSSAKLIPYAEKQITVNEASIQTISSTKKNQLKVTWNKVTGASGYKVEYSTSSTFKNAKTLTISKGTTLNTTLNSLKHGKKYYVRVRAYNADNNTKIYGDYSSKKSATIK